LSQGRVKGLEKSQVVERKFDHDDSFPVALDENLQRITAIEAILWKRKNPNVRFYCPKCIQINPEHRTIVQPSSHQVPRFNRKRNEEHIELCQYRNAEKYLEYVLDRYQIEVKQKTINPKLPSFHAGTFMEQSLQTRRAIYETKEQQRFIQFIESLLQDYEIDLFYQRYGHYSLLDGENQLKFRDFVQTLESGQSTFAPEEGKLQLVVGSIYEVEWSDHYVVAILDHTQVDHDFSLYFHPYHYPKSTVDLLKGRKVACLGYLQKVEEKEYRIEVLSMEHQIAFLDDERPSTTLIPTLKADIFLTHLLSPAESYTPLDKKAFKRSYYAERCRQFDQQHAKQEQKKRERLQQTSEMIPELNEEIIELKATKEKIEKDLDQHQEKNTTVIQKLRNVLLLKQKRVKAKEQDMKQNLEKINEKIMRSLLELRRLKQERSKLKKELSRLEEERRRLLRKKKEEKKLKKRVQGSLYESQLNEDKSVVIEVCPKADRFNVEVDVTLFEVQKMEGYYFPLLKTQQTFATDGFTGERDIPVLIQKIWSYVEQKIQEYANTESGEELSS